MMSPVLNVMNFLNVVDVADLVAKATVVTGFAVAAGWLARRQRAAVRHLIFVAAFVVLGLLPAASVIVPSILVRLPVATATAGTSAVLPLTVGDVTFVAPASSQPGTHGPDRPAISTSTLLQAAWLAGAIVCLLPVGLGLWQIRRVRRQALPWRDAQVTADDLACQTGGRRSIDVVLHEAVAGPMTCGVVRPMIVFPNDARTWPGADVRRALTHEFEHVRRGDWATMCVARAVCAVYWFHPLVWMANRRLGLNAERACDDAVLRDSQAFGYADQLVALAERSWAGTHRPLLAMANRGELSTRVNAVLNDRQPRGPAGVRARIAVATAALASLAMLAPLRTVAGPRGQATAVSGATTSAQQAVRPQFEVASIKPSAGDGIMNVRPLPGRLTADATLQVLMQYAYGVQPFQIAGGPGWVSSTRYEIDARAGAVVDRERLFLMLQPLIEDRFRLKTHREMKDMPVFRLATDRRGLKLPAPTDGACVESPADAALEWAGGGRMAVPGELAPAKGRCGSAIVALGPRGAHLRGGKLAMSELARVLSGILGRPVLDTTEVTARFDVQLDFVPDDATPAMPPPPPGSGISGPSIGAALQQQLGLRLEPANGAAEMIVIDQAERPSDN
jgi:uncharacterized protein (TIGR03435 family)